MSPMVVTASGQANEMLSQIAGTALGYASPLTTPPTGSLCEAYQPSQLTPCPPDSAAGAGVAAPTTPVYAPLGCPAFPPPWPGDAGQGYAPLLPLCSNLEVCQPSGDPPLPSTGRPMSGNTVIAGPVYHCCSHHSPPWPDSGQVPLPPHTPAMATSIGMFTGSTEGPAFSSPSRQGPRWVEVIQPALSFPAAKRARH